jgi:hypothetical protein
VTLSTARTLAGSGSGPGRRNSSCRATAGLTFIEVLFATLIAGTMLVAATSALTGAVKAQAIMAGTPITAFSLAREIHSAAQTLSRTPGDGVPATTGAEVETLDDLDGASFSPPVSARLANITAATGWSQEVDLESVELERPNTPADASAGSAALLRLTIIVREGGTVAGTYVWWLNP